MESLVCSICDKTWEREVKTGLKPLTCLEKDCVDEARRRRERKYYEKHSEEIRARKRNDYYKNREREAARMRRYRESNRERLVENAKRWNQANRERYNANQLAVQGRRRGAEGFHTNEEWLLIKRLCGSRCAKCGIHETAVNGLHRDHIIPISRGGNNYAENLQPLCPCCNQKKSNREDVNYLPKEIE